MVPTAPYSLKALSLVWLLAREWWLEPSVQGKGSACGLDGGGVGGEDDVCGGRVTSNCLGPAHRSTGGHVLSSTSSTGISALSTMQRNLETAWGQPH